MNREEWLDKAVTLLRPYIENAGYSVPEVRVSCGWPSTGGLTKRRRLGECWDSEVSKDGVHQIFISPVLDDSLRVLDVLVHELGHAILPKGSGHKKPFKRYMDKVGLEGDPKATGASEKLKDILEGFLAEEYTTLENADSNGDKLPPYPQSAIVIPETLKKKQTSRMLKLYCPENEDHEDEIVIRTAKKSLDNGYPICYCGKEFILEDKSEDDET